MLHSLWYNSCGSQWVNWISPNTTCWITLRAVTTGVLAPRNFLLFIFHPYSTFQQLQVRCSTNFQLFILSLSPIFNQCSTSQQLQIKFPPIFLLLFFWLNPIFTQFSTFLMLKVQLSTNFQLNGRAFLQRVKRKRGSGIISMYMEYILQRMCSFFVALRWHTPVHRTPRERSVLSSTPELIILPLGSHPLWHGWLLAD